MTTLSTHKIVFIKHKGHFHCSEMLSMAHCLVQPNTVRSEIKIKIFFTFFCSIFPKITPQPFIEMPIAYAHCSSLFKWELFFSNSHCCVAKMKTHASNYNLLF